MELISKSVFLKKNKNEQLKLYPKKQKKADSYEKTTKETL